MGRIAGLAGWVVLAFCTACASDPAVRPVSPHATSQGVSGPGPDRLARVAARLGPTLTKVCDCAAAPEATSPAFRLCGVPITIEAEAALEASTNGRRIRITTGMLRFLRHDDELAFVLAHELSHILLGHAGAFGGPAPRAAEDEADRLGIRIVAKAGFDTGIAARLPERLAQSYPRTNRRSATYGLPTERGAMIGSALAEDLGRQVPIGLQGLCGPQG